MTTQILEKNQNDCTIDSKRSIRKQYNFYAGEHCLELGLRTKIMGILNITPDSFSHDGCLDHSKDIQKKAIRLALKKVREGADIIDIGGESSRPGSKKITAQEEISRIIPTVRDLSKKIKVPISVDTYKSTVAKHALDAGATIINDIKGVNLERSLLKMISKYNASILLMHMQGIPSTMQKTIHYRDVVKDILNELSTSTKMCLDYGIARNKIIIDPGIGFGKNLEHNLEILNRLNNFQSLNLPLLIGTSRKSSIGNILNNDIN